MPIDIKVPSVGESITSGTLGSWSKADGEYVRSGEVIFEVETEKITSEVFAETSGVLHHLVPAGTTVDVGQVVARIDDKAPAPAGKPQPAREVKAEARPAKPAVSETVPARESAPAAVATAPRGSDLPLSPAVRNLVSEMKIDPATVAGTGKGGRITEGDVLAHVEKSAEPSPDAAPPAPEGRTTRRRMSQLRAKIAARLVSVQQEAAILTTFNEVDMSNIMAIRSRSQERFQAKHGVKLGFTSFFVQAVVRALKLVPAINARIDGDEIVENHFYDIGMAVSTEKGLLVPVIREAETLSLAEIERAVAGYARKTREGKITLADLEGGVFTITNGGVFGSLLSTPIINPPQSAILGMHTIQERPVAISGRVEIRPMMYLALSYDHRLIDGKQAVTFLIAVKEFIEQPAFALLDL